MNESREDPVSFLLFLHFRSYIIPVYLSLSFPHFGTKFQEGILWFFFPNPSSEYLSLLPCNTLVRFTREWRRKISLSEEKGGRKGEKDSQTERNKKRNKREELMHRGGLQGARLELHLFIYPLFPFFRNSLASSSDSLFLLLFLLTYYSPFLSSSPLSIIGI